MAKKGCLRLKSPMPSPSLGSPRKSVTFCKDGEEQVFTADEWDRTPSEPSQKLSYQDILELKAIQRSLPIANQPPDPYSGRPGKSYLGKVPIGLLPLLPADGNPSSSAESPCLTPTSESPTVVKERSWASDVPRHYVEPKSPTSPPPTPTSAPASPHRLPPHLAHLRPSQPRQMQDCPPHMAHLMPTRPPPSRLKPSFAFLPLIEPSPNASTADEDEDDEEYTDPPTPSLTNASLDSSPLSRASSPSPEPPPFFLMPPGRGQKHHQSHAHAHSHSSPLAQPKENEKRKKNVMIINGIEIDLDDDDDDDRSRSTTSLQHPRSPTSPPSSPSPSPSTSPMSKSPLKSSPSPSRGPYMCSSNGVVRRSSPCSSPVLVPLA